MTSLPPFLTTVFNHRKNASGSSTCSMTSEAITRSYCVPEVSCSLHRNLRFVQLFVSFANAIVSASESIPMNCTAGKRSANGIVRNTPFPQPTSRTDRGFNRVMRSERYSILLRFPWMVSFIRFEEESRSATHQFTQIHSFCSNGSDPLNVRLLTLATPARKSSMVATSFDRIASVWREP